MSSEAALQKQTITTHCHASQRPLEQTVPLASTALRVLLSPPLSVLDLTRLTALLELRFLEILVEAPTTAAIVRLALSVRLVHQAMALVLTATFAPPASTSTKSTAALTARHHLALLLSLAVVMAQLEPGSVKEMIRPTCATLLDLPALVAQLDHSSVMLEPSLRMAKLRLLLLVTIVMLVVSAPVMARLVAR